MRVVASRTSAPPASDLREFFTSGGEILAACEDVTFDGVTIRSRQALHCRHVRGLRLRGTRLLAGESPALVTEHVEGLEQVP